MVEAYKQQNRFLSSELAELNAVREEDRELYKTLNRYVCSPHSNTGSTVTVCTDAVPVCTDAVPVCTDVVPWGLLITLTKHSRVIILVVKLTFDPTQQAPRVGGAVFPYSEQTHDPVARGPAAQDG